ncbi:caspase family protein [Xanthomonas sacchari]|uniref:caspase family protein n=1 Tax=Xanthomonas sacchari TaxID=56458 RepID=UPI002254868A|nr:caspase family protein [Xanthomonas sacchari]MCW0376275.1 hypothetical protein [Xanthomonas sacchari]
MKPRRVGYVSVGVNRTDGLLPDLQGAASGAQHIANWLDEQSIYGITVNGKTLTDHKSGLVTVRDVQDAITQQVSLQPDILVLFFSGHGIAKSGGDEQVLLSECKLRPDEAVQIATTREDARYLGIPHVLIICDACRNAIDPYTYLGRVNGRSVITRGPVAGGQKGKVDIFYATEPSQTAKEFAQEGIFTKILLETLRMPPMGVYEEWLGYASPVVPAWSLEKYLLKEVPKQAYKASFEQTPDFIVTSREPMFVGMVASVGEKTVRRQVPRTKVVLPTPPESRSWVDVDFSTEFFTSKTKSIKELTPKAAIRRLRELAFMAKMPTIDPSLLRLTDIGDGPFKDQIEAELPFLSDISCVYSLKLAKVDGVLYDAKFLTVSVAHHNSGALIKIKRINPASEYPQPLSVLVLLKEGTFFFLPVINGFCGAISAPAGLVRSMTLEYIDASDMAESSRLAVKVRRAVAAELAAAGRLHHLQKVARRDLRNVLFHTSSLDTTLTLYTCYSLALRGEEDKLSEIIVDVEKKTRRRAAADQPNHVLFDFKLLGFHSDSNAPVRLAAPALPLFGLGWSYLGAQAERLGILPTVLEAGHQRLNCEWTTFRRDYGKILIEMFEKGHLK